jgi:hypothetical protein
MIDGPSKHRIGLLEASELKCILYQLHAASSPTAIATVSGNNEYEINDVSASWCLVPLAVKACSSEHWKKSSKYMEKKTGMKSFCA